MNISLSPELEKRIAQKVERGDWIVPTPYGRLGFTNLFVVRASGQIASLLCRTPRDDQQLPVPGGKRYS
jgi:hypothetical protein